MALAMDVFKPQNPNGIGVIFLVAGGWRSSRDQIGDPRADVYEPVLRRGYTVFPVVTCSMPRFTVPEMIEDVRRAVRFIRANAGRYGISPDSIGIYGCSAGGHLALMAGFTGGPGDGNAQDPVERESSRVQAIGEFYGPTDFLNYGAQGQVAWEGTLAGLRAAFEFQSFDAAQNRYIPVTGRGALHAIGAQISPINHVSETSPPTLLLHGDQDTGVPPRQSESLFERLQEFRIPSQLIIAPGRGHGWPDKEPEMEKMADWFDLHLLNSATS